MKYKSKETYFLGGLLQSVCDIIKDRFDGEYGDYRSGHVDVIVNEYASEYQFFVKDKRLNDGGYKFVISISKDKAIRKCIAIISGYEIRKSRNEWCTAYDDIEVRVDGIIDDFGFGDKK